MQTFISRRADIIPEERLYEKLDRELDLFLSIKKGEFHSRWDIIKKVDAFAQAVSALLKKLEIEKRKSEKFAYGRLLEVEKLLELLKGIDSKKIKKELKALETMLKKAYFRDDEERRLEIRIEKGKKVPGFFIQKVRRPVSRDAEIIKSMVDIQTREPQELEHIGRIKSLVQEIKAKPSKEEFLALEAEVAALIKSLKKDFNEMFLVEVDISIEEAAKLSRIDRLIGLLERLKIKELIETLKALKKRCIVWADQDRKNMEHIEALVQKLEEKTTQIIEMEDLGPVSFRLVVNPYDPDFNVLYDEIYSKVPGWDPEEQFESKYKLQIDMRRKEWFCVVAKAGNKVIGSVYFGYFIMHKWHGAIGWSGYMAVRKGGKHRRKGIAHKLAELSEYYLKKIAQQKGYKLMMVIRFVPGKVYMPKVAEHIATERYLKKIKAKRLMLGPVNWYVSGHDQYLKMLGKWKNKQYILKDLWLDFLATMTQVQYGTKPEDDDDFMRIKKSLRHIDKIKIEEFR